jgi:hypothetical protein
MLERKSSSPVIEASDWRGFVSLFLLAFVCFIVGTYLFILLMDPYDIVPFSLPIGRPIVSISQRFMYPQIVRSKRFDSLIIGTSTSRLLDPRLLDPLFHVRIANLAMDAATPWEQKTMLKLFLRTVGPPKLLVVGLDGVWCDPHADVHRITFRGFPNWLYDDNPWNDYLYLFNYGTLEIAGRLVGYHLGVYPERVRYDGYEVFVPPESQYDPARAHANIWRGVRPPPSVLPPPLTAEQRRKLRFPALMWLDAGLARIPSPNMKILAFMPVSAVAQPVPGTHAAEVETECKARIATIAQRRGATMIDWRIPSALTRNELNYWDALHYRVPIATQLAKELGAAALSGQASADGTYRILVR